MNWYEYPRVDNYGVFPDPFGNYPKPDSNIECPAGTMITALAPGTVSGVETPSWAGGLYSVTVRLDTPVNQLATHMAYNFLQDNSVSVGEHIAAGQQIGTASSKYGFGMAFALTNDDVYGTDTFMQYAGNQLLNPVSVLDAAKGGGPINFSGIASTSGNFLVTVGEWISANIFMVPPAIDATLESVSTTPYAVIGGVSIGLVVLVGITLFIVFVGI